MHGPLNVKININISTAHMKDTTAKILVFAKGMIKHGRICIGILICTAFKLT